MALATTETAAEPAIRPAGESSLPNGGYRLQDALTARSGRVFLTGTQALVRLPLMQRALDARHGLETAGFISGYRGSPLGGYDLALWRASGLLKQANVKFLPAINEEAGATAVLGSQKVETDPERTVTGVFGIWYGKGPGVDRAGDALHHGNAFGSSPHGGVLAVAGDDHGCVSSSMPHQSDFVFQSWGMPVVNPASVQEMLEFGLYGWALSRFSGTWVGFKAISETVESGMTVDLDAIHTDFPAPDGFVPPAGGLHFRWGDAPSPLIETRMAAKLEAVRHFSRTNSIDRLICPAPQANIGILTCGKGHLDLLEALRRLDLKLIDLEEHGIRLYKVGLSFPLETGRADAFVDGLREVLVIEEKGPFIEQQLRNRYYNRPESARPRILGKTGESGAPLLPATGELRPSVILPVLAGWLARHRPSLDRRVMVVEFTAPAYLHNDADAVKRIPYFCSGCPHSVSTRVPEGSKAMPGIGCHYMATWMDRSTVGAIHMGGEGIDWAAHAHFTRRGHMFQNLGDGTYFHSGSLAIRQAVAAKANITYKILYNEAVAMTGGQPIDGGISVAQMARQVEAEGARRVVVLSDAIEKYRGHEKEFPTGTTFHPRQEMDAVQRELRGIEGVTVLIYEQLCAAEKRRKRKKGEYPQPARRVFINSEVCEGCGDCAKKSNCLSVVPHETPLGRKRRIDQFSCNQDYACVDGFCPSFVSVVGGKVRHPAENPQRRTQLLAAAEKLPQPHPQLGEAPFDMLVTGVGGTGIITVGALVTMAAHLDGHSASVLDFMGFAQKGGAVLSYVRVAARPDLLNQVRIDTQQADMLLACDMVVGASEAALQTVRHDRTRVIANTHEIPTDAFIRNPGASLRKPSLLDKMRFAAGAAYLTQCNGHRIAERVLGDAVGVNILMLGFAWQRGLVPVSLAALQRAIELNGVAIGMNLLALQVGRLAAGDPAALGDATQDETAAETLEQRIAFHERRLTEYQNTALARQYRVFVDRVLAASQGQDGERKLAAAVVENYARLLMVKDEYEVARLLASEKFAADLADHFEDGFTLTYHLAPPALVGTRAPRKVTFGPWLRPFLRLLARARVLRGTPLDCFGYLRERRMERALARDYVRLVEALLARLDGNNLAAVVEVADLPQKIRGYGHVKLAHLREAKAREADLLGKLGVSFTASAEVLATLS